MTDECVWASVDDRLSTISLKSHGWLKEPVHCLRPGHQCESRKEQKMPQPDDRPRQREPVETAVVECGYGEDGKHGRQYKRQEGFIPAFCVLAKATSGNIDVWIYEPESY